MLVVMSCNAAVTRRRETLAMLINAYILNDICVSITVDIALDLPGGGIPC